MMCLSWRADNQGTLELAPGGRSWEQEGMWYSLHLQQAIKVAVHETLVSFSCLLMPWSSFFHALSSGFNLLSPLSLTHTSISMYRPPSRQPGGCVSHEPGQAAVDSQQ